MAEYAPAAIAELFEQIDAWIPNATMSGIMGDPAHTYGYHRARNALPSSDYSCQQPDDKQGSGWACSGLDVSFNDQWMSTVTQRLIDAVDRGDDRLLALREFGGTVNGRDTIAVQVRTGQRDDGWDDTHLWHVHLSIYRRWADDYETLSGIGDVIIGAAAPNDGDPPWEQLMGWYESKGAYEQKMFDLMTSAVAQFLKYGPDGKQYGFDTLIAKRLDPVNKKLDTLISE